MGEPTADSAGPFAADSTPATLVDLLRHRARHQGDHRGYTFLLDGEAGEATLTYAELDRRACAIGGCLRELGAAGERALLVYPPGLEYVAAFFGCLYAGTVAVPAYPPRPHRPLGRLLSILADCRPRYVLTTAHVLSRLRAYFAQMPELREPVWQASDELAADRAAGFRPTGADPETLAMLQYTSGSTAEPRGVMIRHRHLLCNLGHIYRGFGHSAASRGVVWLPPYHDMGLIGGILQPLYGGFPVTLMSPVHFLQRPRRWLAAISRGRATTSGGPNFAYDLCVRKIPPEKRRGLDLSSWSVAFNGAEPVRPGTLERFAQAFAPCGFRPRAFYPCYGLAEATLMVSGGRPETPPVVRRFRAESLERGRAEEEAAGDPAAARLVGCGTPLAGQRLAIVDPATAEPAPGDGVGEIWVAGPSVGAGYWNRPQETARTFGARLTVGGGPYLRTGDLGFLDRGELFVTGRLRDLIIIRGSNYHPQDIELTVEDSHPGLRPGAAAAFSVERGGEEHLVVAAEIEPSRRLPVDPEGTIQAIRRAVARHHDLHVSAVVLLRPGGLPRTSSGKVRRHACEAGFSNGRLDSLGEWIGPELEAVRSVEAIRRWLVSYLVDELGVARDDIDTAAPFDDLGLDSAAAVTLTGDLEDRLGRALSPELAYEHPTIDALAEHLAGGS